MHVRGKKKKKKETRSLEVSPLLPVPFGTVTALPLFQGLADAWLVLPVWAAER